MIANNDLEFAPDPPRADAICAFCLQPVPRTDSSSCPRCGVLYHSDCWRTNRARCAVYGCEPAAVPPPPRALPPPPPVRPAASSGSPARYGWLIMVVLSAALRSVGSCEYRTQPPPRIPPAPFRPDQEDALFQEALRKQAAEDYDGALEANTRLLLLNPSHAEAYHNRGINRALKGDLRGALSDYTRAIELDGSYESAWRSRGYVKSELRDYEGAIADCTRAMELDPRDVSALRYRAEARKASGDLKGAVEDFSRAALLKPRNAEAHDDLAQALWAAGDLEGAEREFCRAIEADPRFRKALSNRAYLRYDRQAWGPALEDFNRAFELDKTNGDYRQFRIWLIRARVGDRAAADQGLQDYLGSRGAGSVQDWSSCISKYLLGAWSEERFLREAVQDEIRSQRDRECEAFFYAGSLHLLNGDGPGAASFFRRCLETERKTWREYASAEAELRRLQ